MNFKRMKNSEIVERALSYTEILSHGDLCGMSLAAIRQKKRNLKVSLRDLEDNLEAGLYSDSVVDRVERA
jgi:hypothetical protein